MYDSLDFHKTEIMSTIDLVQQRINQLDLKKEQTKTVL